MCLDQHSNRDGSRADPARRARQQGFAIVAGIFLLMLLAALGALMVTFSNVQHATSAQDMQGTRAYQAARAGLEWGIYRARIAASCAATSALPALVDDLAPFTVTVECVSTAYTEGAGGGTMYDITSTAKSGAVGSPHYVERQLRATVGG